MLQIRPEQQQILARASLTGRLLTHARECAPEVCEAITTSHLRAVVEHCLARCQHYSISRDYDILRFLNLILVYGVSFDQEQPWAAQPLAYPNPDARMDLLMDRALQAQKPVPVPADESGQGPDETTDPKHNHEGDDR